MNIIEFVELPRERQQDLLESKGIHVTQLSAREWVWVVTNPAGHSVWVHGCPPYDESAAYEDSFRYLNGLPLMADDKPR